MNYKEQYAYVIFKYNVYDTNFLIFPISERPNSGFSSLYHFTGETAETLQSSGIAGYKGAVWSPQLVMDFDDEGAAMEARGRLATLGLAHEIWTTGNRGFHFYIDRPHAPSHLLPQIDKLWVKSNFPNADLSIYSHLHMFRNPGNVHDKTGRRKQLVKRIEGQPLLLADQIEKPEHTRPLLGPEAKSSIFENNLIMSYTAPRDTGKRHETLLNLGMAMRRLGEPVEFIGRWIYHTNLMYLEPKSKEELERIMDFIQQATPDESI